jgi:hypothetical protein
MGITLGSIGIIFDVYGDDRCCINCMEGYNHVSLFESSCEHTFLDRGQGTNARLPFPQIVSLVCILVVPVYYSYIAYIPVHRYTVYYSYAPRSVEF